MIELTKQPIEFGPLVEACRSAGAGAVVLFLGTVREMSEGRAVQSLDYETYPRMAIAQLESIASEAQERFGLTAAAISHRYGRLDLGDVAVAVVTASAHRAESFDAARWIMDTIKAKVPIWKRENWADGATEWVHPLARPASQGAEGAV